MVAEAAATATHIALAKAGSQHAPAHEMLMYVYVNRCKSHAAIRKRSDSHAVGV